MIVNSRITHSKALDRPSTLWEVGNPSNEHLKTARNLKPDLLQITTQIC